MQTKMLKTEEEVPTLYDAFCAEPGWFSKDEIDTLNEQLGLDQVETGFLMSKRQFTFWADVMKRRVGPDATDGICSFIYHPLSGHMTEGDSVKNVTKMLTITQKWGYTRWYVNGIFMDDWIYFNNMGFEYVVYLIACPDNITEYLQYGLHRGEYIMHSGRSYCEWKVSFFMGWDNEKQKRVYLRTRFGGMTERIEDYVHPYTLKRCDITPDILVEKTRATLCLIRDAGGDNLLSPDYLPRDLFNLVVGMFK